VFNASNCWPQLRNAQLLAGADTHEFGVYAAPEFSLLMFEIVCKLQSHNCMVFHLQFLHCLSSKQSVNCQSDLEREVPSSEMDTSKQTLEAKQLNYLEQSLQAVTISKGKDPAISRTDMQSLIAQKKGLQSEIVALTKGIDNLKVT